MESGIRPDAEGGIPRQERSIDVPTRLVFATRSLAGGMDQLCENPGARRYGRSIPMPPIEARRREFACAAGKRADNLRTLVGQSSSVAEQRFRKP